MTVNALERVCWSIAVALLGCASTSSYADGARARALGIPFDGAPGRFNAITDVAGVTVGYSTLIEGEGKQAVRTGVTAILPRGPATTDQPVFAGVFSLNGNGEMTGTHWIEESGFLEGPVLITNTHSVGVVRDAAIQWRIRHGDADASGYWWSLPVVAETWDGELNDINGFHVRPEHVFAALESAHGGAIAEGNVGGGTGMICHEFKCGTGTSSRVVKIDKSEFRLGVIVQANYGVRSELRIAGVPVGKVLNNDLQKSDPKDTGSIIIVVATDAPLLPHQLKRLARRASLGLARNGSYSGNGSGDIFIAFSTANEAANQVAMASLTALGNEQLDPLFLATAQAVEESIINAMIAAEPMTGYQGHKAAAIDHQALIKLLKEHKAILEKKTAR
jgi:L-aminopeptidase/D-esterase-like protein